jgi:hypothetical protein
MRRRRAVLCVVGAGLLWAGVATSTGSARSAAVPQVSIGKTFTLAVDGELGPGVVSPNTTSGAPDPGVRALNVEPSKKRTGRHFADTDLSHLRTDH